MGDSFGGRTAVASGAGNGLGRAIALELAARGARIIVVGRDQAKLQAVAQRIGPGSRVAVADVSSDESVQSLAAELAEEEISILINNAGVPGPVACLWDVEADDWDSVFAVNVRGTYLMCKAFIPAMIERQSGDIINVASVSGKRPLARRTPYTASKMAVIGLTTTLAHEVGSFGIRVNTLSPGPVSGPRMDRNFDLEVRSTGLSRGAVEAEFVSRSALGRMVTEEEVAAAAIAMLQMRGLTGADIDLSGGMVAR